MQPPGCSPADLDRAGATLLRSGKTQVLPSPPPSGPSPPNPSADACETGACLRQGVVVGGWRVESSEDHILDSRELLLVRSLAPLPPPGAAVLTPCTPAPRGLSSRRGWATLTRAATRSPSACRARWGASNRAPAAPRS